MSTTNIYVATDGIDTNSGLTWALRKLTLEAANTAAALVTPALINAGPGIYVLTNVLNLADDVSLIGSGFSTRIQSDAALTTWGAIVCKGDNSIVENVSIEGTAVSGVQQAMMGANLRATHPQTPHVNAIGRNLRLVGNVNGNASDCFYFSNNDGTDPPCSAAYRDIAICGSAYDTSNAVCFQGNASYAWDSLEITYERVTLHVTGPNTFSVSQGSGIYRALAASCGHFICRELNVIVEGGRDGNAALTVSAGVEAKKTAVIDLYSGSATTSATTGGVWDLRAVDGGVINVHSSFDYDPTKITTVGSVADSEVAGTINEITDAEENTITVGVATDWLRDVARNAGLTDADDSATSVYPLAQKHRALIFLLEKLARDTKCIPTVSGFEITADSADVDLSSITGFSTERGMEYWIDGQHAPLRAVGYSEVNDSLVRDTSSGQPHSIGFSTTTGVGKLGRIPSSTYAGTTAGQVRWWAPLTAWTPGDADVADLVLNIPRDLVIEAIETGGIWALQRNQVENQALVAQSLTDFNAFIERTKGSANLGVTSVDVVPSGRNYGRWGRVF